MTSDGTSLEKLPGDVEGLIFFTETEQHKLLIVGQNDKEKSVYAVPNSDRAGKTRCKFYFDHDTAASYESVKLWRPGFWRAQFPLVAGSNLVKARCQRIVDLFEGVETLQQAMTTQFGEQRTSLALGAHPPLAVPEVNTSQEEDDEDSLQQELLGDLNEHSTGASAGDPEQMIDADQSDDDSDIPLSAARLIRLKRQGSQLDQEAAVRPASSPNLENDLQGVMFAKCVFTKGRAVQMVRCGTGLRKTAHGSEEQDVFVQVDKGHHCRYWWGPSYKPIMCAYRDVSQWFAGLRAEDVVPEGINDSGADLVKFARQARIRDILDGPESVSQATTSQWSLEAMKRRLADIGRAKEAKALDREANDPRSVDRPIKKRKLHEDLTAASPLTKDSTGSIAASASPTKRQRQDSLVDSPPEITAPVTAAVKVRPLRLISRLKLPLTSAGDISTTTIDDSSAVLPAQTNQMSHDEAMKVYFGAQERKCRPEVLQEALSMMLTHTPPLELLQRAMIWASLDKKARAFDDFPHYQQWSQEHGVEVKAQDVE